MKHKLRNALVRFAGELLSDKRKPTLVIDIRQNGRFHYPLIFSFIQCFNVELTNRSLGQILSVIFQFRLFGKVNFYKGKETKYKYFLSDDFDSDLAQLDWKKRIYLSSDWYKTAGDEEYKMPYYFHPNFYSDGLFSMIDPPNRVKTRSHKLFFAGTYNKEAYDELPDYFGMLKRYTIISSIQQSFSHKISLNKMTGHSATILFHLTSDRSNSLQKFQLSQQEVFQFLSNSDYALCPPGCFQPPSHNLVEALSQGAIPLCNYGHLLPVPLEDGRNSLLFKTIDDLISKVEFITKTFAIIMMSSAFS